MQSICASIWKSEKQVPLKVFPAQSFSWCSNPVQSNSRVQVHGDAFGMSRFLLIFQRLDCWCRLFERGLEYVGTDYLSHLLWDKYIDFEYSQEEWSRLAQIYTRVLQIPLQQLDRYYSR